jgi:hypothetical protein
MKTKLRREALRENTLYIIGEGEGTYYGFTPDGEGFIAYETREEAEGNLPLRFATVHVGDTDLL